MSTGRSWVAPCNPGCAARNQDREEAPYDGPTRANVPAGLAKIGAVQQAPKKGLSDWPCFAPPRQGRRAAVPSRTLVDHMHLAKALEFLITYEAQLPAAGPCWQGFRRLRDDLSGRIDRRFALSNDPPTAIDHRVRAQAELRT